MCQVRECAWARMLINTVNTFLRTPRRDWRKEIPVVEQRDISVNFHLPRVEHHLTYLLFYSAFLFIIIYPKQTAFHRGLDLVFPPQCSTLSIFHLVTVMLMHP